ncbi:MAG: hypothetical protein CSB48_03195 [Proteobacteria bacterium]|nr:MAG: hypothetical protein CSB48_03195 [Pseudomonadota bacterium]
MRAERGFTLVELVMVIVIGSILAMVSVRFIASSMQGVVDTAGRQQMAMTIALVSERISRELRQALPNSVRIYDPDSDSENECIEFVPVRAASRYSGSLAGSTVTRLNVMSPGAVKGFVSVYPITDTSVYPNGSTSTVSPGEIDFSDNLDCPANGDMLACSGYEDGTGISQAFPFDSPQKRFFVTGQPVSFCRGIIGGESFLLRYFDYGFQGIAGNGITTTACPAATCQVVTNHISRLEFSYSAASLSRSAVVTFLVELVNDQNETLSLNQQVQVRNVP